MTNLTYKMIIVNTNNPEKIREKMVQRYYQLNENASKTAREYKTRRQTVKKWVERYEREGMGGLKDKSKAPKEIPGKTPIEVEDMIEKIVKDKKYSIGQDRVQIELEDEKGIHLSTSTINRIMNDKDLIKKRKKKWKKKKQISKYRKTLDALKYWQVDVKELRDIPNIYALVKTGIIPGYQYSARDVVTGTSFVCYGWEYGLLESVRFIQALFEHLRGFGTHSSEVTIQTDNGSEFIGSINAKKSSIFENTIEKVYHSHHKTIPIGKKEWQGSVETFHNRIEAEFYDVEEFDSLSDFLGKAYSFILYWNLKRKQIETKKNPFMFVKQKCHIFNEDIGNFQPLILNDMETFMECYRQKSVRYVADEIK